MAATAVDGSAWRPGQNRSVIHDSAVPESAPARMLSSTVTSSNSSSDWNERRQAEGELVSEQHLRSAAERARQRQHLLFAAGQQTRLAVMQGAERREQLVGVVSRHTGQPQVVARCELHDHRALLGDEAEALLAPLVHRRSRHRAEEVHLALAGRDLSGQREQRRRLACAVRPDQRDILIDDPSAIPGAVEELLRYEAPSPVQARRVMRDVEVHGQTVTEGSVMLLLTGAAGRDEREYTDPDRFDVRRGAQHMALGLGVHFCLGAALARLEGRVGIEEFLARFPKWEVDEDRMELVHTSTVRGPARLPISV